MARARLPNGDVAGGEVILGLRSGLDLYANVRPVKLYKGVNHKVHGVHKEIWDSSLVDLVMVRENTEGLYHSLLRRMAQSAVGKKDEKLVIEKFPGLGGSSDGIRGRFQGTEASVFTSSVLSWLNEDRLNWECRKV